MMKGCSRWCELSPRRCSLTECPEITIAHVCRSRSISIEMRPTFHLSEFMKFPEPESYAFSRIVAGEASTASPMK